MRRLMSGLLGGLWLLWGCSQSAPVAPVESQPQAVAPAESAAAPASKPKRTLRMVQIGEKLDLPAAIAQQQELQQTAVMDQLRPLQILLGQWKGTSRKAQLDEPEWVWDLQTDRQRPALVMQSAKGAYIRSARLTYLPDQDRFQLGVQTPAGEERILQGELTQPVADVAGDNEKLQRTFKLTFAEEQPVAGEQWQLVLHQQDNNRYILEVDRKRGGGPYQRLDTINTLREGTSFALSDSDYGDKTCIISQGLGTISVSHAGRTFWVCCSGCQAAFEEEPARWIAKWESREAASNK
jgi:ribosomal protein L24E